MYREFWHVLFKEYGRLRSGVSIFLITVALSVLEGLNIGLLVPLLETLASSEQQGDHWISGIFNDLFDAVGIPFGLNSILLAMGVLILVISALKYTRLILIAKAQWDFTAWMRTRNMWVLLNADMSYFHKQKVGVLSDILTTQANQAGSALLITTEILSNVVVVLAYVAVAFLISPLLTVFTLGMLAVITMSMQFHIAGARSLGADRTTRETELQAAGLETLSGIHVVKSFLLERLRWNDFWSKSDAVRSAYYELSKNLSQMTVLQEMALFALIGGVVYLAVSALGLGIAVIIVLLFTLYRLAPRVSSVNNRRQRLVVALASLQRVNETLNEAVTPKLVTGTIPFTGLSEGIDLKNVSFSYNGGSPILIESSFSIEKGKMTAIVGASGAGKSTIIDLILRFYEPIEGQLLVDGVDLKDLDLISWRKSIGVVSQDTFLFNDTVASNISMGRVDSLAASNERVRGAAVQAYADDFINQLPQGYNTVIGDRGWNLSGGQRQRIALARAILENPQVLILDEATSSLDSESERLIQQYLDKIRGTCTIVIVAHRLSTVQHADKIVVLEGGKIVEEGNWDSLISEDGIFASYYQLQAGN